MIKAFAAIAAMLIMALPAATSRQAAAAGHHDRHPRIGRRLPSECRRSRVLRHRHVDIREDGRQTLARQAEWLKQYTNYQITIEGHCDERGTREYNLALGERRANAARSTWSPRAFPPQRIKTISYGKERPEPVGSDEGAWARNRRAVTELQ